MHPLINNLSDLNDTQLETKLSDLNRKYWLATNQDMRFQLAMIIEDYQNELQQRRLKVWKKQQDEMDVDLASLIRVE